MKAIETGSPKLPFLGSLENGEPFEYLLLSIDTDLANIALLKWFVNRLQLHIGDKIDLHLSYPLSTKSKLRGSVSGTVIAVKHSQENQGEIYQVSLFKEIGGTDVKYYSFDQYTKELQAIESPTDLFLHLIKDSMVLKAGIRVYFRHLISYFSRIADYPHQEYDRLERYFLHDIEIRIIDNEAKLEKLYQIAKQKITKLEEISVHIDLEFLRETIESEISLSLFNVVFSEVKVPNLSIFNQTQSGIFMYINAIKNLEKRLYSNYNHIVIIYLKSIA